jgi:hypothetical protein
MRFADTYFNITGHHGHHLPACAEMINIPASRFLRPYSKKLKMLEGLKFNRIRKSMEHAATNGLIYQLWWHPHNFGNYTEENFKFLEKVLMLFSNLKKEEKMKSLNLNEIYIQSMKNQHEN